MAVSEKSKANLVKFTKETARANWEKSLAKRKENRAKLEALEAIDEAIVKLFGATFQEVAAVSMDPEASVALRLEAGEIVNKDRRRGLARLDRIRDRVQGKPRISADVTAAAGVVLNVMTDEETKALIEGGLNE